MGGEEGVMREDVDFFGGVKVWGRGVLAKYEGVYTYRSVFWVAKGFGMVRWRSSSVFA